MERGRGNLWEYDFDREVNRRGTDSLKYDFAGARGHKNTELSLWVADMDFPAPPEVLEALSRRVSHGIFGYTESGPEYFAAVKGWITRRLGWTPEKSWLVKTPGVVFALAMAVRAFTEPGNRVLIQPPVYYPFFEVVRDNGRVLEENALVLRDGRYEMDFDALRRQLRGVKLMLLCSPHNPVGRVWTREELRTVAELCAESGTILLSDEIHCDFIWGDHAFVSAASFLSELQGRLVICTSPAKSFNLAGLQVSNIFLPDPELKRRFRREIAAAGYSQLNTMGLLAGQTAYEKGEDWFEALKRYLTGNLAFLREALSREVPGVKLLEPEGTYLAWLDFQETGLSGAALDRFIREEAELWLDDGSIFGGNGARFQRLNFATRREVLREAVDRLSKAVLNRG